MRKLLLLLPFLILSCTKINNFSDPTGTKVSLTYILEIDSAIVQPYDYLKPPKDGFGYIRNQEVDSVWSVSLDHYYQTDFRRAGFRIKNLKDSLSFKARVIADGILVLDTVGVTDTVDSYWKYLLIEW